MAEVRQEPGLRIGIIGVGRLGHLLATYLIQFGDVYPQELFLVGFCRDSMVMNIGFSAF